MNTNMNAKIKTARCAVAGFALAAAPAFGYDWESITSGGVATIPSGVTATVATDADIAAVTALKGIVFADETASVSYTSKTALDLRAAVSGAGTLSATSSGKLVLWGDNSALASPGHFSFDNSPVVVSNRFGLGSAASASAVFNWNSSSSLNFGSPTGAFTNEVALSFTSVLDWPIIGSSSTAETFVQSNDCYLSNQNGCFKFKNNCEFIAGKISNRTGFFYNERSGDNVNVRYTGTSQLYVPEWYWLNGNSTTTFTFGPDAHGSSPRVIVGQGGAPVVVFAIENYFDTSRTPTLSLCKNAVYDLNGFSQQFYEVDNQYFGTVDANNTAYVTVRSATPAVLKTSNCTDGRDYALLFEGRAGYSHDVARTNGLANVLSTSRGLLDVAKGRIVLKWNAGWSGDATVRSGAELEVASSRGLSGGLGKLTVEDGGKLVLNEGAGVTVCELKFGSSAISEPGKYSVASLRAAGYPVEGPDDLTLSVVESFEDPWEGWPTTPGATAKVPRATTVFIYDADVANVSQLASIKIGPQGRVICSNETQKLVLTAQVSGYGSFEAYDSAGLELAGDNSGLESPGAFSFYRSPVTVSNRHGLGGGDVTDEANFYYGTDATAFKFRGKGLTNDVPLRLHITALGGSEVILGGENVTDVFVQNASLLLDDPAGGRARRINFCSETHLTAGIFPAEKYTDTFAYVGTTQAGIDVYLEGDAYPTAELFFQTGNTLHLACDMNVGTFSPYSGRVTVCEAENACTFRRLVPMASMSVFDLNGYDQSVKEISDNYDSGHQGSIVTSAVPAAVTLTAANAGKAYGIKFRDKAGLVYDTPSVENTIENLHSDTIAPLVVSRGTLGFAKGAGWGGTNVTVCSGATLKVAANAADSAFAGPNGTLSRTDLVVEQGGTLDLAGGTVPVRSFTYDGQSVLPGLYGVSDGVGISGAGRLQVRRVRHSGIIIIFR